jgi:hypothetical protein
MPQPRRQDRHAVYLCQPAEGWKPQRVWDYPQTIVSAHLYRKRLSMDDALAFARIHNQNQERRLYAEGQPITEWAMVVHYLRPRNKLKGPGPIRKFVMSGELDTVLSHDVAEGGAS